MPDAVSRWTIGPARETDLAPVRSLLDASGLPAASVEEILETLLVARTDVGVVGCAGLELYGESALLRSVAVAQSLRGTGLGKALTRATLDAARARGIRAVFLLTDTAEAFFPKFGFRPIERAAVDPAVQQSEEFRSLCPASAVAMELALDQ